MNGMNGWSSRSVWRRTRSWIARQFAFVPSSSSFDFETSTYQSQKSFQKNP
jgi:hypothetical protein